MKRTHFILIVAATIALLAGLVGLRRVPSGFEAVRVSRGGDFAAVEAGWHFAGPGTRLLRYPIGVREFRVPEAGAAPVIFLSGQSTQVAFRVELDIPPGSASRLFQRFTTDFPSALERLVVAAAEIEAASIESSVERGAFASAVANRMRDELVPLGIGLRGASIVRWGDWSEAESPAGSPAPRRLVIVAVDGGDWLNLRPLMDAGRLPNFARLASQGATGPLRSEEPMLSPLLWTTMATGRYPEDHGILNFTVVDPETGARVPISRHYRRVDAFWNMLGDYHRSVAVIGWLATDPAESVDGLMVTDKFGYLAYAPGTAGRAAETSVYPPSRRDELSALAVHADAVPDSEIARFVSLPGAEIRRHHGAFDPKDRVNNLIHLYASTLTFRNIALHELRSGAPDVLAVYFEWVDAVSHLFMLHAPPRMPDVAPDEYEKFSRAVEESYVLQDRILGEIMDEMDDRSVLMVISDHGFKSGESRLRNRPEIWAGNAALWHRPDGIVAFYGPGVRKGYTIEGASILDVTPTLLALMGLPRAADMPGKPLESAFEPDVVASFAAETVATLDRKRARPDDVATGAETEETMKKLEALGYLTPDNADAQNNLGQRYQQRGEYRKAIEAYREAIRMRPNFYNAYNNLAVCYGELKMYTEAEEALRKCIALKPDDHYAFNNLAVMYIQTGRVEEGMRLAENAVQIEPAYANGRVTLGSAYAMQRRFEDAEVQFREALRLDPGNETARVNMEKLQAVKGGRR